MIFYIDGKQINEKDLLDWARKSKDGDMADWIRALASTIFTWFDNLEFISLKTSGSTGTPKMIQLSKSQMRQSAQKTGHHFNLKKGMMTFNCLPCQYIAGKMMVIRALVLDLDQICVEPKINLELNNSKVIDFAAMTPLQLESTLQTNKDNIIKIRKLIIGGAPILPDLMEKIQNIPTECYATYGMTETITHVAISRVNGPKASTVFNALEGVRFEVNEGNLVIIADHLDQRIVTTDQVNLISDTAFVWLGRSDHVINKGGVKLHPEQIESKLKKYIDERFIVTGFDHPSSGQDLGLVIEAPQFNPIKMDLLLSNIRLLNKIERPQKIIFTKRFEETPTGKIKRNINWYPSSST